MSFEKKFNGKFDEKKRWQLTEKTDLVLSLVTDQDNGDKRLLLNKQWTTKDGKRGTGKGSTVPLNLANEVADAIKAAASASA